MPIATIQLPNGKIAKIEVPQGATEDQIMVFVQSQVANKQASELPIPDPNKGINSLQAGAIAAGRGLTTIGRAVGLVDPERPAVTEAFAGLQDDHPISTTVGEIAGESAPFIIPGMGAGAALTKTGAGLAVRSLTAAGLGAAEGGAITRGKGGSVADQLMGSGIGGVAAGTLELVLPSLGRLGSKVIRRALGRAPKGAVVDASGKPSREFLAALKKEGTTFEEVVAQATKELKGQELKPDQAARSAFLSSQGIKPTRAQISRTASDFQAQQEAAKTSGAVREALEGQEAVLTTRFNNAVLDTGGQAVTPTSTVTDALVSKATALDQQIGDLYTKARSIAPGAKNVRFDGVTKKLRELAPSDRRAGGNISAIVGDMQSKGILDDKMKVIGKVDVETAEDLRKLTNELFDKQNGFGNIKLREIKDAIDDDVFKAAGTDVFKEARKAKSAFERDLTRAKVSKFDSRKTNIVRDVLEDKIDADRFAEQIVFSKKYRDSDIQQLKDYITTGPDGVKAFDDLRADVLNSIKEKAFIGPEDAAGNMALSRDKLVKAVKSVGDSKLKVLFNEKERKFLTDMIHVSKLREPVRGTQQGLGPTAQAIGKLEEKLRKIPIFGALVDFIDIDASGKAVLRAKPQRIIKDITPPLGVSQVGGAVAASQLSGDK